jgi:hypothetical protein
MAELIPWSEFEAEYAENFPTEMGAPAKSFRMALGALIIKEKLGISDRETVEQVRETPICNTLSVNQPTVMNYHLTRHYWFTFDGRISPNLINKVNERMVEKIRETTERQNKKKGFGRQK